MVMWYFILLVIVVVCLLDAKMKQRQLRARAGWVANTERRSARY